jgi:hypothetical protein
MVLTIDRLQIELPESAKAHPKHTRAVGATRDRGVHAGRALYATSPAYEARLCNATRRVA